MVFCEEIPKAVLFSKVMILKTNTVDTQVPPGLQFECNFQCSTSWARTAVAKFFTLQAQAIAGLSSCREVACYSEILRISYNFVRDSIISRLYEEKFLTNIGLLSQRFQ